MHYAGARYYSATNGKFISQDPYILRIGTNKNELVLLNHDPQRWNTYSYALNNPVRLKDNNGESASENEYGHLGNVAIAIKFNPNLGGSLNEMMQPLADVGNTLVSLASNGAPEIIGAITGENPMTGVQISSNERGGTAAMVVVAGLTRGIGDDITRVIGKAGKPIARALINQRNRSAANKLGRHFGVGVQNARKGSGYKFTTSDGYNVRIMNNGGQRTDSYIKITNEKGALNANGEFVSGATADAHISTKGRNVIKTVKNIIKKNRGTE